MTEPFIDLDVHHKAKGVRDRVAFGFVMSSLLHVSSLAGWACVREPARGGRSRHDRADGGGPSVPEFVHHLDQADDMCVELGKFFGRNP